MKPKRIVSAKTAAAVGRPDTRPMTKIMGHRLTCVLLLLLVFALVWGSLGVAQAAPKVNGRFSLDFINTDLVDVFKALATQSRTNVVLTSGVQGKTTLSLRNVNLEDALRLVSASNGLDYAWVDVAYVVGKPEEIRNMRVKDLTSRALAVKQITPKHAQEILGQVCPDVNVTYQDGTPTLILIGTEEGLDRAEQTLTKIDVPAPPSSKLISLNCASAEKVMDLLKEAIPDATVQYGPLENSLIVTADGVRMAQAENLIAAVDVVPDAAQAFTAIYVVRYASPKDIVRTLSMRFPDLTCIEAPHSDTPMIQQASGAAGVTTGLLAAPQSAGGSSVSSTASSVEGAEIQVARIERLILMGAEYTVNKALELLEDIDVPSRQVKIKAIISRVNRETLKQVGIDWSNQLGGADTSARVGVHERGADNRDLKIGGFTREPLDFVGELRALENSGYAKILAEPSVVTLDGRQVAFHSGDKIFFETVVGFSSTGSTIRDIREVDVGITLVVTPHVNSDGNITLTLAPSFATATFREGLETTLPVINERTAISSVRVQNGESVVIAGLVEDTISTSENQIPILGDIPIVGQLFKHTKKQHIQDELVILVTPELVD